MSRKLSPEEAKDLKEFAKAAFDAFDTDKSGQIEVKEFEQVLKQFNESSACKQKLDDAAIKKTSEEFIRLADKDSDGKVNFQELYKFLLVAVDATE
jgi:Ca2+-binding EF-hand superfamily protein